MEGANISDDKLKEIIIGAVSEHVDSNDIGDMSLDMDYILYRYHVLSKEYEEKYVIGKLDTFKRAACLLCAINESRISSDENLRADIAISASLKMCEQPYWNIGENFDTPVAMETINFKEAFSKDQKTYDTSLEMLKTALVNSEVHPLNIFLNLETFYYLGILLKHMPEREEVPLEEEIKTSPEGEGRLLTLWHRFIKRHQ